MKKLLLLIFTAAIFSANAQSDQFNIKFAFAEANITPPGNVKLPCNFEPSKGVHDPLYMRVLAVRDSKGAMQVIIGMDLINLGNKEAAKIRQWYADKYKRKPSAILFNASHSHSAPRSWQMSSQTVETAEKLIDQCVNTLQNGYVKFALIKTDLGVSRRVMHQGKCMFACDPNGYYDPDLPILAFYDNNDKLKGIVYSYAAHPSTCFYKPDGKRLISADWPGELCKQLKDKFGRAFVPLFLQGAAGDTKTRTIDYRMVERRGYPAVATIRDDKLMTDFCRKYSDLIAWTLVSERMKKIPLDLDSDITEITQYYDMNHPQIKKTLKTKAQLETESADSSLPETKRNRAKILLKGQWYAGGHPSSVWQLQKVRLNDKLQILAHSGEPTSVLGRLIKDQFPGMTSIMLGYIREKSYMASYSQQLEGGYESKGYGPDAEDKIIKTFKETLKTK